MKHHHTHNSGSTYFSRVRTSLQGNVGMGGWAWLLVVLLAVSLGGQAHALVAYDSGALNFSASDQSMWATGGGASISANKFLGAEWTNETMSLGGVVGKLETIPTVEYAAWLAVNAIYQAADDPGPAPSQTVTETIPNPLYAAWWTAKQAYDALYPGPAPTPQYITETGPNPLYAAWLIAKTAYDLLYPGSPPSTEVCGIFGCGPNLAYPVEYALWLGKKELYDNANPGSAPSETVTVTVTNPLYATWWINKQAYDALYPGLAPSETVTTTFPNPLYALWLTAKTAYDLLDPGPEPSNKYTTLDTRTGAKVDLSTSGKVGIEAGFTLDSGSVDATADFSVKADLPDGLTVGSGTFFNINSSSTFDAGTVATQSPTATAYVKGVLELSGSISGQACLIAVGCAGGSTSLPSINYHPEIISISPTKLSLFGGNSSPVGFETNVGLAKESIVVRGDLVNKGLKVVTTNTGAVLFNTMAPTAVATELAKVTFKAPDITTSGSKSGSAITSSGRDTVVDTKLDLDGVVGMAAGFSPNVIATVIDKKIAGQKALIEAQIDIIDVKAGPTADIFQNFELTPTLKVDLTFNKAVKIAGLGTVTSYSGAWDSLPDMAFFETTTVTPRFWLDAVLKNTSGVDFGFELDLAALKAAINVRFGATILLNKTIGPVWSKSIPLGGRFAGIDLFDKSFAFNGFNSILANPFTLTVPGSGGGTGGGGTGGGGTGGGGTGGGGTGGGGTGGGGTGGGGTGGGTPGGPAPVPEPGTLLLIGVGLAMIGGMSRAKKRG